MKHRIINTILCLFLLILINPLICQEYDSIEDKFLGISFYYLPEIELGDRRYVLIKDQEQYSTVFHEKESNLPGIDFNKGFILGFSVCEELINYFYHNPAYIIYDRKSENYSIDIAGVKVDIPEDCTYKWNWFIIKNVPDNRIASDLDFIELDRMNYDNDLLLIENEDTRIVINDKYSILIPAINFEKYVYVYMEANSDCNAFYEFEALRDSLNKSYICSVNGYRGGSAGWCYRQFLVKMPRAPEGYDYKRENCHVFMEIVTD